MKWGLSRAGLVKLKTLTTITSRTEIDIEQLKLDRQRMMNQLSQQKVLLDKILTILDRKGIDINEVTE